MSRYLLLVCLVTVFATAFATASACAPVPLDTAEPVADSDAAAETTPEAADPSDEDATEHEEEHEAEHEAEHEGEHEGEHEDEHEEEHADERRELGAHEHGAAQLTIAWSGSEMAMDLQTPAYNVLGFEYAPTSDEEQALLEESVAALEGGDLLQISPDAGCTLVSAAVQAELADEAHDEEAHDEEAHDEEAHDEEAHDEEAHDDAEDHAHQEDHGDEVHSDIDVAYNLECQQPDNITSLDASALFAQFPNFEDIQVQWVSDTQQSAADLTPNNPVISFE